MERSPNMERGFPNPHSKPEWAGRCFAPPLGVTFAGGLESHAPYCFALLLGGPFAGGLESHVP